MGTGKRPDKVVRESAALPDDPIGTEGESVGTVKWCRRRRDTEPSRRRRRPRGTSGATFLTSKPADSEHWRLARRYACSTCVSIRRASSSSLDLFDAFRIPTTVWVGSSDVKQIFVAQHPTEAHLVRGLLEANGISAEVRGESLFGARGAAPTTPDTLPSVWVDESDAPAALVVLSSCGGQAIGDCHPVRWLCASCGERLEPQFAHCWHCGTNRPSG